MSVKNIIFPSWKSFSRNGGYWEYYNIDKFYLSIAVEHIERKGARIVAKFNKGKLLRISYKYGKDGYLKAQEWVDEQYKGE